jgi:hypothetical protein
MARKRISFSPCSERDVRAAALKATHERLKEMDERGEPTIGRFGEILRGEMAKIRSYGEEMAKKGINRSMSWEELKKAVSEFSDEAARKNKYS